MSKKFTIQVEDNDDLIGTVTIVSGEVVGDMVLQSAGEHFVLELVEAMGDLSDVFAGTVIGMKVGE